MSVKGVKEVWGETSHSSSTTRSLNRESQHSDDEIHGWVIEESERHQKSRTPEEIMEAIEDEIDAALQERIAGDEKDSPVKMDVDTVRFDEAIKKGLREDG